jgi:hypothetical protein
VVSTAGYLVGVPHPSTAPDTGTSGGPLADRAIWHL